MTKDKPTYAKLGGDSLSSARRQGFNFHFAFFKEDGSDRHDLDSELTVAYVILSANLVRSFLTDRRQLRGSSAW